MHTHAPAHELLVLRVRAGHGAQAPSRHQHLQLRVRQLPRWGPVPLWPQPALCRLRGGTLRPPLPWQPVRCVRLLLLLLIC